MTGGAMRHAFAPLVLFAMLQVLFAMLQVLFAMLQGGMAAAGPAKQPAEPPLQQSADAGPALPDTLAARVAALASMESLDAAILGSRSATAVLEAWCATHAMVAEPRIIAERVTGAERPASDEQRRRLLVGPDERVRHRHVRLTCGTRVLSEADNWYVPSRLAPAMNAALETTDAPFGKVVAPLGVSRQTFSAAVLWTVLPPGWELHPPHDDHPERRLAVPPVLFEHRALLLDRDRLPFSEVDEHDTRAVLAFGPPEPPEPR